MKLMRGTTITDDMSKQEEILLIMKQDIYERIPNLFDIEEAQKQYPIEYIESINTVLIQELERYNDLLLEIRNSLITLEQAVKGLILMSTLLEVRRLFTKAQYFISSNRIEIYYCCNRELITEKHNVDSQSIMLFYTLRTKQFKFSNFCMSDMYKYASHSLSQIIQF